MNNEITLKAFREIRKRAHVCRDCGKQDAYTLAGRTFCYDCTEEILNCNIVCGDFLKPETVWFMEEALKDGKADND